LSHEHHHKPEMSREHGMLGHSPTVSEGKAAPKSPDRQGEKRHHAPMIADFRRRFWVSLIITIPVLFLSPLIQQFLGLEGKFSFTGDLYALWALSSVIFFYGGYPFLKGIYGELRARAPGMMTLIGISIITAYAYSTAVVFGLSGDIFFWELVTLIDIMLLGHWLEMRSVMAASSALEELARLMPYEAHRVKTDGIVEDVPLNELFVGDRVLVKPGEKVPADGRVMEGETSVNEAMLTGESAPVSKKEGAAVIGGSINGEGSIMVAVAKTGKDSFLAQMTELVRSAQASKSQTQNLADRAAFILVIVAISTGVATILAWLLIASTPFVFALSRMVTVMVIACPHALGLAIPLVVAVSTSLSAKNGLLIKDRNAFEQARNVRAVLFDKTGTLTQGKFGVSDVISLSGINEKELLKYAASLERNSEHPIAKGIVSGVKELLPVENFISIPGKGVRGTIDGKEIMVVSPGYLQENRIFINDERISQLTTQGKTVIYILLGGKAVGAIALADIIRPEARQAIANLKAIGIRCMMITGDNKYVAKWVAEETGLDEYFAEVLPGEKAKKVKEIQSRGLTTAMTGDGVNDAPALAQADLGIAIGAGTDVAVASADVILVRNNPLDVVSIIRISRATYGKMIQNLAWATGYNIIAIPLAAGAAYSLGILLSPALGAALMALSTIIVAINSRFLRVIN